MAEQTSANNVLIITTLVSICGTLGGLFFQGLNAIKAWTSAKVNGGKNGNK